MVLAGATPAAAGPPAVRQLAASPGEIRFVVDVPELRRVPVSASPGEVELDLDGYEPRGRHGEPAMPERVVCVAVPPTGDVSVTALGLDEQVFETVRVAARYREAVPGAAPEDRTPVEPEPPRLHGGAPARLLAVSFLRRQRVARIAVTPVRYDAGARVARVWRSIEVRVMVSASSSVAAPATMAVPPRTAATAVAAATTADDPFERVYREALVNYDEGRAWRSATLGIGAASAGEGRGVRDVRVRDVDAVIDTSVFVGRRWVKIGVPATGLYRLRYGQFRRFAPFNDDTTTRLDSLTLITLPGLPLLPDTVYCDSCDYRQVAFGVVDNGDGKLNRSEDALYFYALGPSDWEDVFDPSRPDTNFLNHPYENRNYYYLGIGSLRGEPPLRITTRSAAVEVDGDEVTPTTFPARLHREVESTYDADHPPPAGSTYRWDKWFWTTLDVGATFRTTIDAPGADTTAPATVRARLTAFDPGRACAESFRTAFVDVQWNGGTEQRLGWKGYVPWTLQFGVPTHRLVGGNALAIEAAALRCNNQIGVSWVQYYYRHRYQPEQDRLDFRSFDTGSVIHRIEPFTGATPPRVLDVTNPYEPVELLQLDYAAVTGGYRLSFEQVQTGQRHYIVVRDSSITDMLAANITAAPATSLINLRDTALRADYLVIYYDEFHAAADTLAEWRRASRGWEVKTVPISALYDQFSGGRTDPASIRNFLRAATQRWAKVPDYVEFLGDASYDFKNQFGLASGGRPAVLLPTYEGGFDAEVLKQFTTDDWLLNVNDPVLVIPDFLGGRIPAVDPTAALDVVRNKILFYERGAPLGDYRNRIMLIADDQEQGNGCDNLNWTHLTQTTTLDQEYLPEHFDRDYVYLHTYPGTDTKPLATDAVIEHINGAGVFAVNYIGHGSPFKLADETVLGTGDLGALRNDLRLPVFFAASCDVGKFSDPKNESMGELLVRRTGGGAIAVISSTELAFSGQNARLNANIFEKLFDRSPTGTYQYTLSEALLVGKLGSTNNQKYQLMGDAATRPNLPRLWVELALDPLPPADTVAVDSLTMVQGASYRFTGRVVDRPGGDPIPLDGIANVLVEDSAPILLSPPCVLPQCLPCGPQPYRYRAGPIFRGDVEVRDGQLEGRFIVPLEARPGGEARIRAYLAGGAAGVAATDGVGAETLTVVTGTPPTNDTDGPEIRLSFPNGATAVRPDATLRVDLSDPNGILITGHSPQNAIVVTIDGNSTTRVDITDSFRYNANSFQTGSASFTLDNLSEGPHTITVSAADNLAAGFSAGQHRSTATIEFEVLASPPLEIRSAYLFPNPTASRGGNTTGGRFIVDAQGDALNVLLRIYTVSGRLIRTLTVEDARGQVQVPWDGLDGEGQALSNGVYLFKVHVNPREDDGLSDPTRKAEAEGRFVVVNR